MELAQFIPDDRDHVLLGGQLLGFIRSQRCGESVQRELIVDQDRRRRDTSGCDRLEVLAVQVALVSPDGGRVAVQLLAFWRRRACQSGHATLVSDHGSPVMSTMYGARSAEVWLAPDQSGIAPAGRTVAKSAARATTL